MVISSIHGATSSDDISPLSNRLNTRHKVTQSRNRNAGSDSVTISQEALAKTQSLESKTSVPDNEELPQTAKIPQEADLLKSLLSE